MPRFFFHIIDDGVEPDDVGSELPSIEDAKREGGRLIGSLMAEGALDSHGGAIRLEVTDDYGLVLFHVDVTSGDAPAMRADCPEAIRRPHCCVQFDGNLALGVEIECDAVA